MDWNKEIKKCEKNLKKAQNAANELTSSLVNYIDKKVKSVLLTPFLGEEIEIEGREIKDIGNDFSYEIYQWVAKREGMSKRFFLVLTGDRECHLPSHFKFLGRTEMSEKIIESITDKFSEEALEEMIQEFEEKWLKAD